MSDDFHLLLFFAGAFWFYRAIRTCLALQQVPFVSPGTATAMRPWISIVVVVRDVASDIEDTIRDLIAQRDVEHEVIVVDDRTEDGVAATIDAVEAAPDLLRVERIDEIREGWLPKANAFACGIASARGEWLVFVDHPLRFEPNAIARCLQHARKAQADHLTPIPRGRSGLLAPLVMSAMMDSLPGMAATNRDRDALPMVCPATLMSRDALAHIGGYEAFKMTPFAEMAIAQRMRERGFRLRVAHAGDEIASRRPLRAAQLLETLERVFAALDFHLVILAVALLLYASIWFVAAFGAFSDNIWGYWAVGGIASQIIPALQVAQTYRAGYFAALLTPLTLPVEVLLTGFAMARLRLRRGVVWQGCYFSIDQLRRAPADEPPNE